LVRIISRKLIDIKYELIAKTCHLNQIVDQEKQTNKYIIDFNRGPYDRKGGKAEREGKLKWDLLTSDLKEAKYLIQSCDNLQKKLGKSRIKPAYVQGNMSCLRSFVKFSHLIF